MAEVLFKEESFKIIGACFEVYNQQVCGFVEPVYQECLEIEFGMQHIPFKLNNISTWSTFLTLFVSSKSLSR